MTEIEIFAEDCEDDTVEVVVLNSDDTYDDIDQQYKIDDSEAPINEESLFEKKEKQVDEKFGVQNVTKKFKKNVQSNSTRQTRSCTTQRYKANKTAQLSSQHVNAPDLVVKQEEYLPPTASWQMEGVKDVINFDTKDATETDVNEVQPDALSSSMKKKRRGRPKTFRTETNDAEEIDTELPSKRYGRSKISSALRQANDMPARDTNEGESGDEFPARDSDNEDWPAQTTLDDFPTKIIENGLLLVKGKKLMSMICKYYKLECDLCEPKKRFK